MNDNLKPTGSQYYWFYACRGPYGVNWPERAGRLAYPRYGYSSPSGSLIHWPEQAGRLAYPWYGYSGIRQQWASL